jgi:serine/threonine protein kinase
MRLTGSTAIDSKSPPFDQFKSFQLLATARSGRRSLEHVRHHLYVARDKHAPASVLIKVTAKPGLVYQQNLANEIASLSTINRELPDSRYFPVVREHGSLRDGRVYLITSLFDEFPLATAIGTERLPERTVGYLRTTLEVAKALTELHRQGIFHVDLNPMNILHRTDKGAPVIRIVDFESSYEVARHSAGDFYSPPTTPGYSAPEVGHRAPDARADLFSLGAVLYTMLAGFDWTWKGDIGTCVQEDRQVDPELREILSTAVDPDPDRRYPSIEEFHTVLAGYLEYIWPGRSW